jgi:fatty-acid desaturase
MRALHCLTKFMATAEAPTTNPSHGVALQTPRGRLELPETAQPMQFDWGYLVNIVVIHVLSIPVIFPWFFSWTGLFLFVAGLPGYGLLGITLCYHRLLTHQGLMVPKWLERTFALLGVCCLQDTPARWVAVHRLHHRHSDRQPDPHSPLVNFFWSHVGWVLVKNREHSRITFFEQYARDILRDPLYLVLERNLMWFWVYWAHVLLYYVVGLLAGRLMTGTWWGGFQFGLSVTVWGAFLRTVAVWHVTWSVNSVTHVFGYRNYQTHDDSRNHWLVALLAHGEGWHNNHHADQRAAAHGHRWWEFDLTFQVVRVLEMLGLAKNVVRPRVWRSTDSNQLASLNLAESEPGSDQLLESRRS